MPKKSESTILDFGKRLANMRKASGLTQQQLGEKVGVSKRVIAYYEGETDYPPTHLIATLAKALSVSTDELLGLKQTKETLSPNLASLWRRLKVIENFSEKEKKSVLQYVEIIAEKHKPQQKGT
jgi:transcriptional regulator with XRE-family HTH domain